MAKANATNTISKKTLPKKVLLAFPLGALIIALVLFLPAGSLNYWQGWLFLGSLFIPLIFILLYFLKNDPEFLQRRMQYKEKETQQKKIVGVTTLLLFLGFIVPGLDYRFGWSSVHFFLVLFADLMVFLSYMFIFFVFKENSYCARTVRVEKGQKIVTTGPYSFVRHPMYLGIIVMYLFIPLALGSYYALIFFVPTVIGIIFRTLDEERVLLKELKGYKNYKKKVKYRIFPRLW